MKNVQEIQQNGFLWVNVTKQSEKELKEIGRRFDLKQKDLEECLPPFQRPKMLKRPHYNFLVLHFPVFDRTSRRLSFTEVDFFLTPNYLVTIHDGKLPAIEKFFKQCETDPVRRGKYFTGSMAQVFLKLMTRLLEEVFPSLLHINEDINAVDRSLFDHPNERKIASEILRLKTNVVTFRRTMQGHRSVLERLVSYADRELELVMYQNHLNSVREFVAEIWHMLESQKESIYALHETNESIINYKTGEVMKTLTIISVLTFPLTLFATILAIRAPGTPMVNDPIGFWVITGLLAFLALLMIIAFKFKKWI